MRTTAWVAGALVAGAALVAVPTTASASSGSDDPSVRRDGGSLVYTDPGLAAEDTTRVSGVLRRVVVEPDAARPRGRAARPGTPAPTAPAQQDVIVMASGVHVPVEAGTVLRRHDVVGDRVVAELVEGPALEAALDGEPEQPVEVAEARFAETSAAAASAPHRVYLAIVANSGSSVDSTTTIQDRLAAGMAWWQTESGATFGRAATARYSSGLGAAARCGFGYESQIWSDAAKQFPGVSFTAPGNHLVVVVDDGCTGTGVATLGDSMDDGGSILLEEAGGVFTHTFAHELGHNVGLEHANLESDEYWDLYSPMGLSIVGSGAPSLDAEYRSQLGIADAGEVEVVPSGTTVTRTLASRGATSGLRGLEVRSGGTSHWVEWRSGSGRDAAAYYPKEADGWRVSDLEKYPKGVTVSTRTTGTTGETSLRPRTAGGVRYGARTVGQTYTSGSLTISVDAITASGAQVTVSNGGPPPVVEGSTPTVTGTPKVGSTLTAQPGTWTTGATLAYEWRADGTPIAGATAATFVPTAAQLGTALSVQVIGSRAGYLPAQAVSAPTAAVAPGTLTAPTPTVSGTPRVGNPLTAQPGTWTSGTTLAYLWLLDGAPVASGATFTPTADQRGRSLAVRVTGTKAGYTQATRDSEASTIGTGVLTARTPTISGTAKVGSRLSAAAGTWTSGTALAYQWFAAGTPVSGATASSFVPGAAQRGKAMTVRVTGTKDGYTSASRTSAATRAVAWGTLRATTPRISGTPKVGRRLSVLRGTWTAGTTFSYRWYANGKAISGATRSTYTPTKGVKGKRLTVRVTGRKAGYTTVSRTSGRTSAVR